MTDAEIQDEIIVVGNGVLALFLANELADRGQSSVTVVGPAARSGGASQAAAAMLGCFAEVTGETLASDAGRAKFEIGLEAHRRWPSVLAALEDEASAEGAAGLRTADETFVILNAVGGELDTTNYEAMLSALREYGGAWDEVSVSDIVGYRPRPDRRAIKAVRLPGEGAIDARRLLDAARSRAARRGIRFRDDAVTKVVLSVDGRVEGVQLATGETLTSATVVVAAGAYSQALVAPSLARHQIMPVFAGVGLSVVVDQVVDDVRDAVVRTPNRAFACGLHSVPLPNGQSYLGATNVIAPSPQTQPSLGDGQFLATCAIEQIDDALASGQVHEWRSGNRPVSLDGFPLIGWTSTPGLYLMTGTYRDGFHCAPVLAEHAADQLMGKAGTLGSLWEPERRPLPVRTVEQSIDAMVEHRLASWFEADAHGPPTWSAGKLGTVFRDQASRFYDQLRIEYGLGADIVAFMMVSLSQKPAIDAVAYLRQSR